MFSKYKLQIKSILIICMTVIGVIALLHYPNEVEKRNGVSYELTQGTLEDYSEEPSLVVLMSDKYTADNTWHTVRIQYECEQTQTVKFCRVDPAIGAESIAQLELDPKQTQAELTVDLTQYPGAIDWELWFYYDGTGALGIEAVSVWKDDTCEAEIKGEELVPAWGGVYDGKVNGLNRYRVIYDADQDLLRDLDFKQDNAIEFLEDPLENVDIQVAKMDEEGTYQIIDDRLPYAVTDTQSLRAAVYGASEEAVMQAPVLTNHPTYAKLSKWTKAGCILIIIMGILALIAVWVFAKKNKSRTGRTWVGIAYEVFLWAVLALLFVRIPYRVEIIGEVVLFLSICFLIYQSACFSKARAKKAIQYVLLQAIFIVVGYLGCKYPIPLSGRLLMLGIGAILGVAVLVQKRWLTCFMLGICSALGALVVWVKRTWPNLSMQELLFQLKMPAEGTGGGIVLKGVLSCAIPTAVLVIIAFILLKKWKNSYFHMLLQGISIITVVGMVLSFCEHVDLSGYLSSQGKESEFIEYCYVDPATAQITFPEKKRNLIYIFMESMETSYMDQADGGLMEENLIPELTELAKENQSFAGDKGVKGARVLSGNSWTMGALFGQTSGLPLEIDMESHMGEGSFFPTITTLGEILKGEGYNLEFLIGSDAYFGGRKTYFESHGPYEIKDYYSAIEEGRIDPDYYVWWGYEDEKLFAYAKDELNRLSKEDEPFNLTLLTVDTHFEDGYVCELCEDQYPGNQYANVISCSSRQISQFVEWIKQQDFYENTTIILSGDHLTMDSDFFDGVDGQENRRTYVTVINPAVEPKQDGEREFTTLDMFPTTLGALGAKIEGDRLGLGTDLFSDTSTLLETYGLDYIENELAKKSYFLRGLSTAKQ